MVAPQFKRRDENLDHITDPDRVDPRAPTISERYGIPSQDAPHQPRNKSPPLTCTVRTEKSECDRGHVRRERTNNPFRSHLGRRIRSRARNRIVLMPRAFPGSVYRTGRRKHERPRTREARPIKQAGSTSRVHFPEIGKGVGKANIRLGQMDNRVNPGWQLTCKGAFPKVHDDTGPNWISV